MKYYRNNTDLYTSAGEVIEAGSLFVEKDGKMQLEDEDLFFECEPDETIFYEIEWSVATDI